MDHVVPDWHTFGSEPAAMDRASDVAAASPVWRTPRMLLLAGAATLAAVAALVAGAMVLAPASGGVTIDLGADAAVTAAQPGRATAKQLQPTDGTTGAADARPAPAGASGLTIDIEGAVVHPGLVHLAAGDRVGDAILRAGGFSPRADLRAASTSLNLAQSLTDGLKVVVPEIGLGAAPAATTPASGSVPGAGTSPVDLNHATQAELEALPGIGPVTAAHILEARAQQLFATVDDLRNRSLVGAATFDKLRTLVTVAP